MSTKSRNHRPRHMSRRKIVRGAFGKTYIRKGGKTRNGYFEV